MSINSSTLYGNLANDPTMDQKGCVSFQIAYNEYWSDKDGNQQQQTYFAWVRAYGKLARNCMEFLAKGSPVTVQGKLNGGSYKDKHGNSILFG